MYLVSKICIFRLVYISCRATIDHSLMRKALITELRTFVKMSGFTTVTSIYFGGGKYMTLVLYSYSMQEF